MLKTKPAVFAVGDTYQIMVPVTASCLMSVRVGERMYHDQANGILRASDVIHKVTVPMEELDRAGGYTLCMREILAHKPYHTELGDTEEFSFNFRPVPEKNIRAFMIGDAHADIVRPVDAARHFGEMDFLILNGDINNDSAGVENYMTAYKLASELTGGEIPVVSARGNHDMRGAMAVECAGFIPTRNGETFFTFRLGNVWGIVLDCGEDKDDSHPEYGGTVCCHEFRLSETNFIRDVIARRDEEYCAEGVEHRVVISHVPFTMQERGCFDIENEIYTEWSRLLREEIGVDMMFSAHVHWQFIMEPGDEEYKSFAPHPCPVVVGTAEDGHAFAGTGIEFGDGMIKASFVNNSGETLREYEKASARR